jgi:hydrogenase maturation protease
MNNSSDGARDVHFDTIKGAIKIIGIGQSLRGDDAAGLAAVRLWKETYQARVERPDVQVELAELPGIGLLNLLEGARVAILVDAVNNGDRAGTVYELSQNQLEAFKDGAGSAHGWGVAETLLLGRTLMPAALPVKLFLIGIEVGQLDMGEALSPEVGSALSEVARLIEQYVSMELIHL